MKKDKLKGKLRESYHILSMSTLNNKINGNSRFYLDEVEKLPIMLNLPVDEKIDIFKIKTCMECLNNITLLLTLIGSIILRLQTKE